MTIIDEMREEIQEKQILEQAKNHSFDYLDTKNTQSVYPKDDVLANLSVFDESLPSHGTEGLKVLDMLHSYGSPATVISTGGRYFGFVNGSTLPIGLAARWLVDTWDQNAAMHVTSPIASKLEDVVEKWLVELFGLPKGSAMGMLNGTSTATMVGLIAARDSILKSLDWDVYKDGLFDAPKIRVILSEQSHTSVNKALALIGLGSKRVETVPADNQGRIDPDQLPELDQTCVLILQAGNVNTGAFDDFNRICKTANKAGAWVHIDGAFGLWAAASSRDSLVDGIELADSWSVDAHKTLNSPYDCGIVFCKDRDNLTSAMQAGGSYLYFSDTRDGMAFVPDMSRRARSIEVWAIIKRLGRNGILELVDKLCDLAQLIASKLEEEGFELLNDVVFNQVLVGYGTDDQTEKLIKLLQESGDIWLGGTTYMNRRAIRISICSWMTTEVDIERTVQAFVKCRSMIQG